MQTDTELKIQGITILTNESGAVNAERFIALLQREPFDYTEWQKKLWSDKSIHEISKNATRLRKKQ